MIFRLYGTSYNQNPRFFYFAVNNIHRFEKRARHFKKRASVTITNRTVEE
jgi:hypothetical protein